MYITTPIVNRILVDISMSPSENTRSKTGALADQIGNYDSEATRKIVEVKASGVCDGLGVFAMRDIWPGMIITAYAAVSQLQSSVESDEYTLEKNPTTDLSLPESVWVGISQITELKGRGVGQLVNDAINPIITGKINNARFIETYRGPYVIATRIIRKGDEILSSYGFGYWKKMVSSNPGKYSSDIVKFMNFVRTIEKAIGRVSKKRIYQILDLRHGVLRLQLEEDSHKCPYSHLNHFDDLMRLRLQELEDDRYHVYQYCIKCGKGDHLLATVRLNLDCLEKLRVL